MNIIGIELESNRMNYVVIRKVDNSFEIISSNRIVLSNTRERNALIAFQDAVKSLFNASNPEVIAIKEKPESGRLRAGAASMKMEGIILANAPCKVDFVSGRRINQSDATAEELYGYLQTALKTAHSAMIKMD